MARALLRAFPWRWRMYTTHAHPGVPNKKPQCVDNKMIDLYKYFPIKFSEVESSILNNEVIKKKPSKLARMHLMGKKLDAVLSKDASIAEDNLAITSSIKEDGYTKPFYLVINNLVVPSTKTFEARMWFPKGVKISIKHPFAARLPTGKIVIEVENPLYVDYIGAERPPGTIQDTYDEANRALKQQDFIRAANLYTECLADDEFADRLGAFRNRAEAWHGAGHHEAAYFDIKQALYLNKSDVRAINLRGKIFFAMGDYRRAMGCFMATGADESMQKKCAVMLEQKDRCDYDFTGYYMGDRDIPELSEYLGPLAFGKTTDGRGTGIFATEDMQAGQVLAVYNAAVVAANEDELKPSLFHAFRKSKRTMWQCLTVCSPTEPEIEIFRPGVVYEHDPDAVIWFAIFPTIEKLTSRYAFRTSRPENKDEVGVWTLPAIFNHSCVPNVSQQIVGTVAVLRAARDISSGDELCIPYMDVKSPVHARRSWTQNQWGFLCTCTRCKFEAKLFKDRPVLGRLSQEMQAALEDVNGKTAEKAVFKLVKITCQVEKEIQGMVASEEQINWLRTSFCEAYAIYMQNSDLFRPSMELPVLPSAMLMEALHWTCSGSGIFDNMLALASIKPSWDYEAKKELILEDSKAFYGKDIKDEDRDTLIRRRLEDLGLEFQLD